MIFKIRIKDSVWLNIVPKPIEMQVFTFEGEREKNGEPRNIQTKRNEMKTTMWSNDDSNNNKKIVTRIGATFSFVGAVNEPVSQPFYFYWN